MRSSKIPLVLSPGPMERRKMKRFFLISGIYEPLGEEQ